MFERACWELTRCLVILLYTLRGWDFVYIMGGRSGAIGCVWGILFELHVLLDVPPFC